MSFEPPAYPPSVPPPEPEPPGLDRFATLREVRAAFRGVPMTLCSPLVLACVETHVLRRLEQAIEQRARGHE